MDIYKYKIWTGKIPGIESEGCPDAKLPGISRNFVGTQSGGDGQTSSCPENVLTACKAKFNNLKLLVGACEECFDGGINECCPDGSGQSTSCCGTSNNQCIEFWSQPVETIVKYCKRCNKTKTHLISDSDNPLKLNFGGKNNKKIPDGCKCCNRTSKEEGDGSLVIFLDQDMNDMGYYSIFDGNIMQKDTLSNFVVTANTTTDPYLVSLTNVTEFQSFKYLESVEYTVNWGDGTPTTSPLIYPNLTSNHSYPAGTYPITLTMSAPWGISSFIQEVTIPFITGQNLWSIVPNTGQTYTFLTPDGSSMVSMDYHSSEWGPLDSGLDIHGYITSNYTPVPYTIQGSTQSMLPSFKTYSNAVSNSPDLPNGYNVGVSFIKPIGGQVQLPDGTIVDSLQGWIDTATPTFTAYTVTNGVEEIYMLDDINGETVFTVQSFGVGAYDLLTRECGFDSQGVCDVCSGVQTYYFNSTYTTQSVFNDRGVWDTNEEYDIGDYVFYDGCCFFAINTIPMNGATPDKLNITSVNWRLCYGSCLINENIPSRYDCIDGVCVEILPNSNYYSSAQYIGAPPTSVNAQLDCMSAPCVLTSGEDIHYECNNGSCDTIIPNNPYYNQSTGPNGGTMYGGPTAWADCDFNCVSTTTTYNCVTDQSTGTQSCLSVVGSGGFFPNWSECNDVCTGVNFYDYWCVNNVCTPYLVTTPGTSPNPGNVTGGQTTPYLSWNQCNGLCGGSVISYRCLCSQESPALVVNLGGEYGGQSCIPILDALNPGEFTGPTAEADCQANCVSWDCDNGSGDCTKASVDGSIGPGNPLGVFCSDADLPGGGIQWDNGVSTMHDVSGCDDNCTTPTITVCIAGTCTPVILGAGLVNPSHPGTQYEYDNAATLVESCYPWDMQSCQTAAPQGCGCIYCDSAYNAGYTQYPIGLWTLNTNSGSGYYGGDAVFTELSAQATNTSHVYKYWLRTDPVCKQSGMVPDPNGGPDIDCSTEITNCEDPTLNLAGSVNGGTHACTLLMCPYDDNSGLGYMAQPPLNSETDRWNSLTCWQPCRP